ncbi:MAG: hypothetical protein PHX44_09105 [Sulfurimonas sp.]|uniref:hypothetical protein n=1 Tax=Sulfurimonas sp. TaxID=2022749 RepID=UPI002637982D|nr:hypothetical protein [Sulfurimonas sp.]MDD2653191.1 hypothetical protein [Sulfurimonas sp.]MDD3452516.1 hypothetical protein [Sulfurimonas sp.]
MNKVISVAAISIVAAMLTTGCSVKSSVSSDANMGAHVNEDAGICKTAIYIGHLDSKSALEAIGKAGKKEGWRMTEFKSNALIAEKVIDGTMRSTTVSIAKEHITCSKDNIPQSELDALRAAIVKELQHGKEKH